MTDDCPFYRPPREEGAPDARLAQVFPDAPDALDGPVVRADLIAPVECPRLYPAGTHRGWDASAVPDVRRDPAMGVMDVTFA